MSVGAELPRTGGDGRAPMLLLDALESSVRRGDLVTALALVRSMRSRIMPSVDAATLAGAGLTSREQATLALMPDASLSQKDMARALGVSRNTLKTHIRSLYLKLGVHSRAEAIERAGIATPRPVDASGPDLTLVDGWSSGDPPADVRVRRPRVTHARRTAARRTAAERTAAQ